MITLQPLLISSLMASAQDYLNRKDAQAAIIQLKNALKARPDSAKARLMLGQAVQTVAVNALLHPGAVVRVEIFLCHFFTSHLYVLLVLLYTE